MSLKVKEYTIDTEHILGKGQYGIVYDCSHPQIKAELCVKIVKTNSLNDKLIKRESEILMKLKDVDNPNLVKVYDVIPDDEKKELYIIMEKVKGGDLKSDIERRTCQNLPQTMTEVLNILSQIIKGYRTLFILNIIHRDLKPANILIENGKIKITDFGMGRVIEDMNKRFPHTKVGTPAYASPQIYFETSYSSKTDIYSLGIILFQLVFLKLPFQALTLEDVKFFVKQLKQTPYKCEEITLKGTQQEQTTIRELIDWMLMYHEENRTSWEMLFNGFCAIFLVQNYKNQSNYNQNENIVLNLIQKEDTSIIVGTGDLLKQNNQEIHQSVSSDIIYDLNKTRVEKFNRLIQVLQAKSNLADQLLWAIANQRDTNFTLLSNQQYNLLLTCVAGYKYFISLNCYGLLHNDLKYICEEITQIQDFTQILQLYQSDQIINVKIQVQLDRASSQSIFQQMQNKILDFLNKYPKIYSKFSQWNNTTQFMNYHSFFKDFYKKYLFDQLNFNSQSSYSLLKFIALVEIFLKTEEEYPIQQYFKLDDPKKVYLPGNINEEQLIELIKQYRQH